MKKFSFRLERLRELRERSERERAAELGARLRAEAEREEALRRAREAFERAGEQGARSAGTPSSAGMMQVRDLARGAASRRIDAEAELLGEARQEVDEARSAHRDARQSLRAVERLKEKRLDAWRDGASRDEQQQIDDLPRDRRHTGETS